MKKSENVFPKRLRQLREFNGWSQDELARRLKISRSTIGNYEQGTREPSFEDLETIADVFNCTLAYLIEKDRLGPDELYNIKESVFLTHEESAFFDKYSSLNFMGKKEIDRYLDYMLTRPEFRKESESNVSSEVS